MEDDRKDEHVGHLMLDAEAVAHYQRRAEPSGRTLEAQLGDELAVLRGHTRPDSGDTEAAQFVQMIRRMHSGRMLRG
jgi:hypothetical protein